MSNEQGNTPRSAIDPRALRTMLFTSKLLLTSAQNLSDSVDSFSGWIIGGFGAVIALLLSNIDKLRGIIGVSTMRHAASIYIAAAILGVIGKVLALMVASATKGISDATALAYGAEAEGIDLDLYRETAQRALLPHSLWMLKKLQMKAFPGEFIGDLHYVDRFWFKCAQTQALIALIEAILVLVAAGTIILSL
jgi:hypothetical protein